ncbi:hypothetical protein BpHYR1_027985, partial [Brachionus plicatilis]
LKFHLYVVHIIYNAYKFSKFISSKYFVIYSGFNKNVTQKKPRPNKGQRGRPSRPVCGTEPVDLSDLAGRPKRPSRPVQPIFLIISLFCFSLLNIIKILSNSKWDLTVFDIPARRMMEMFTFFAYMLGGGQLWPAGLRPDLNGHLAG